MPKYLQIDCVRSCKHYIASVFNLNQYHYEKHD